MKRQKIDKYSSESRKKAESISYKNIDRIEKDGSGFAIYYYDENKIQRQAYIDSEQVNKSFTDSLRDKKIKIVKSSDEDVADEVIDIE